MAIFGVMIIVIDPFSSFFWEWNDTGSDEVYTGLQSK